MREIWNKKLIEEDKQKMYKMRNYYYNQGTKDH